MLAPGDASRACSEEQSVGTGRRAAALDALRPRLHAARRPLRDARFGPSEGAFGHPGAGGSLGFADPDAKLGFGYAMNKMGPSILVDARPLALIDAVYASLA